MDLFVDRDYKDQSYEIQGDVTRVLGLEAASTDHDLTGQVIWPVSVYLACYIKQQGVCRGKHVVELGAGGGLPGFAVSGMAASVALTDGNEYVLDMLRQTQSKFQYDVAIAELLWGDRASVTTFLHEQQRQVDVILGADVVAWPNSVEPLLQTVRYLLLHGGPASQLSERRFFCGFVTRALSTERLFFETASAYGFLITERSFLCDHPQATSAQPLRILELTLASSIQPFEEETFLSDDPERYAMTATAC